MRVVCAIGVYSSHYCTCVHVRECVHIPFINIDIKATQIWWLGVVAEDTGAPAVWMIFSALRYRIYATLLDHVSPSALPLRMYCACNTYTLKGTRVKTHICNTSTHIIYELRYTHCALTHCVHDKGEVIALRC